MPYRGNIRAYLLGWGGIIPLAVYIPYYLLEVLDVRNKILKLAFTNVAVAVAFRCVEAMYGTTKPSFIESSLSNYCLYYSACVPYEWDSKTQTARKITPKELGTRLGQVLFHFTFLSLHMSFMMHVNFQPFPTNIVIDDYHLSWELLSPNNLANGYLTVILLYFVLWIGFEGCAFGENVKGYATYPIFSNPLMTSTSAIDFWTRKWNTMIHRILKVRGDMERSRGLSQNPQDIMEQIPLAFGYRQTKPFCCC